MKHTFRILNKKYCYMKDQIVPKDPLVLDLLFLCELKLFSRRSNEPVKALQKLKSFSLHLKLNQVCLLLQVEAAPKAVSQHLI